MGNWSECAGTRSDLPKHKNADYSAHALAFFILLTCKAHVRHRNSDVNGKKEISDLSIEMISRGMWPFFLIDVGMLMIVTFVPWTTLALPKLILG